MIIGVVITQINEKVEKVPFMVDTEVGCRAIVKAIEKEGANSYVPSWPWSIMVRILKIAPLSWLKKMS